MSGHTKKMSDHTKKMPDQTKKNRVISTLVKNLSNDWLSTKKMWNSATLQERQFEKQRTQEEWENLRLSLKQKL